eukprot:12560839-Ditylum_brightwellii.AAC.1
MVSAITPVWHCKIAFKLDAECCFALCNSCYIENESGSKCNKRTSRKRQRRLVDPDADKTVCNHSDLQAMADTTYFKD